MTTADQDQADRYGIGRVPESREVREQAITDLIDWCTAYVYLPVGSVEWVYAAHELMSSGIRLRDPLVADAVCSVALASRLNAQAPGSALALLTGAAV